VVAEQHHDAAAEVPSEAVVVVLEQPRRIQLHVRLEQSDAAEDVRPDRPDLRHHHEVVHQRQHARGEAGSLAEEIAGVCQLQLEADDVAHRAEGYADVAVLVFAITGGQAARIAAEVETDQRTDESLCVRLLRRRGNGQEHDQRRQHDR
jgi:hypothetical protein